MDCFRSWELERRARRLWCIGGPNMPIGEVAFAVGHTEQSLRLALRHIPKLSYFTIRSVGLEALFDANSTDGRALGFLANGDAFDILDLDSTERKRMAKERANLWACLLASFKKLRPRR